MAAVAIGLLAAWGQGSFERPSPLTCCLRMRMRMRGRYVSILAWRQDCEVPSSVSLSTFRNNLTTAKSIF